MHILGHTITWWQFLIAGTAVLVLPQVWFAWKAGRADSGDPRDVDRYWR